MILKTENQKISVQMRDESMMIELIPSVFCLVSSYEISPVNDDIFFIVFCLKFIEIFNANKTTIFNHFIQKK
jgi:hypothetical protein